MKREAAALCLGVWLMGTVCVSIVATQNFYTIDRLLTRPDNADFVQLVEQIGTSSARDFLRYLSSELNRLFFQIWNYAQFAIGGVTLWLVVGLREAPKLKWFVLVMLAVLVLLTIWLTPQIVSVGRSLDFVPRDPPPAALQTFGLLHAAYTILEMLKLATGVVAVIWLLRSPRGLASEEAC